MRRASASKLRRLKQHVRMDVLEHADGVWEIVYGPSYTRTPKPRPAEPDLSRGGPHPYWAPGWVKYSTWGYDSDPSGQTHLHAQLIANQDGPDAEPRILITPPSHVIHDIDGLAEAIAAAIAPYQPVTVPTVLVKQRLSVPPVSWG